MTWPPDYTLEIKRRIERIVQIKEKPVLWGLLRDHYKTNPVDFINHWCVTYDPRNKPPIPKVMPFVLFPKQEEFIWFLYEMWRAGESGLIEKCRDMGASWLCCAFSVWLWLFHEGSAIGWGSRKEEYVDKKGDPKAVFPKIRQILEHLPDFILPVGFDMDKHATYMKIVNIDNGSTMTGEAGDQLGRGGRTSIYFKDESAHYEHPELIEAALGDNTDVQIDISSVNGSANVFYRRRMAGEIWEKGKEFARGVVRVFIFDWRDHPLKTQEWYDARRNKAEREGLLHMFAQEVDRDYSGSVERVIIESAWVNAAVDAHIKLGFGDDGKKIAAQDVADEGGDKNALAARHGVVLKYIDHWGGSAGDAARKAIPECATLQIDELYYDVIGVGSGFKNEINNMQERGAIPARLKVLPWNAAESPTNPTQNIIPGDLQSPTNENFFANLKAQAWWNLRTRFYKTYMAVTGKESYDSSELISLPSGLNRLHELKIELSQAVHTYNGKGKVIVDKKPNGAHSPNLADAVTMAYTPISLPGAGWTDYYENIK